ncbi:hypothetical protein QYE76_028537 [Lolium multiflorum]|uniref:Uncharacterized protein n=1 Tax=Lolium multiflorum TaxID=4521 RepID=A0AAD8VFV7_LOLMU|nr:hypothetical protein QYE76_028537 [Lolium multiflorum]
MAAVDLGTAEWERSKITNQDINLLKKLGISKKPKAVCFPSEESYPTPPMGYRDSGTSKPEEPVPSRQKAAYDPYLETLISSDDEEKVPASDVAARTKKLAEVNERANTLAQKLEQSEEARKAESDAVHRREADKAKTDLLVVEDLRKRLHDAETSLSDIYAQSAREEAILKRLRSQNRRFVGKTSQEFELEDPDNDPLLDAVSFLEFHGTKHARALIKLAVAVATLPYFFPRKRNPQLSLLLPSALIHRRSWAEDAPRKYEGRY